MPFRAATALFTVWREGVLSSFVTHLKGTNPVVKVKLPATYAPDVYVSVMAVRGRVTGGESWLRKRKRAAGFKIENSEGAPPTAPVDLAKPDYRMRSEEHPSQLQTLMRITNDAVCLEKQKPHTDN